jgi:Protein of unknown function (DUF1254)
MTNSHDVVDQYKKTPHFREFPDASNKSIVGLNVDTLYSLASLDLAQTGSI